MTSGGADSFDLVVLGGGAAGLAAARAARWEDASVALISDAPLGGDCTFTGCVPSKSLIEARGVLTGPKTINVEGRIVTGDKIIIATGSKPGVPPIAGIDSVPFRTNETFFEPRERPRSLVVIGAGPIGCELGEAMARFGTTVTLVEFASRVLGRYEADAAALVQASMRELGIDVRLNTAAKSVRHDGTSFHVDLGGDDVVVADELLVAAGRSPITAGIGLDAAGVALTDHGYIKVDDYLRTNVKGVFAAGDCNGVQMLSHAADEMGRVAAWTALRTGRKYKYDPLRIPHAVFTTPEVAAIGVLEADASDNARVAEIAMSANDRALAAARPEGFVRLIARPARLSGHKIGGKVIGATIVGGSAGEMINEVALIMRSNSYGFRLAQTVRAYPSWSTVMQKAATLWFYDYEGFSARPPRRNS